MWKLVSGNFTRYSTVPFNLQSFNHLTPKGFATIRELMWACSHLSWQIILSWSFLLSPHRKFTFFFVNDFRFLTPTGFTPLSRNFPLTSLAIFADGLLFREDCRIKSFLSFCSLFVALLLAAFTLLKWQTLQTISPRRVLLHIGHASIKQSAHWIDCITRKEIANEMNNFQVKDGSSVHDFVDFLD